VALGLMNKPVLFAVIGAAGLLALTLTARQCRGPEHDRSELRALREQESKTGPFGVREAGRSGWVRRRDPDPGSVSGTGRAGVGSTGSAVRGARANSSADRSSGAQTFGSRPRERAAGGALSGGRREAGRIRAGAASGPPRLPFDDPEMRERLLRGQGGLAGRVAEEPFSDETVISEPEEPVDEDAPVLSLFDGEDMTDMRALVAEGVTLDEDGSAHFSTDSEFAVPIADYIDGTAGTISFWLEPGEDAGDAQQGESLLQIRSRYRWENRVQIWRNGSSLYMVLADNLGTSESGAVYRGGEWFAGERRLVTMTWGDGRNALWVNGELAGESEYEGELQVTPETVMHIGSNYKEESASLNGTIGRFQVFNRQLDAEEVGALAAEP
jgi:hypothetical protein